jgi:hypothetical protein
MTEQAPGPLSSRVAQAPCGQRPICGIQQGTQAFSIEPFRRTGWRGFTFYGTLAQVERDATRKGAYVELAASERQHAQVWLEKLRANGVLVQTHKCSAKTRVLRGLVRVFGPAFVLPTVAAAEYADRNKYAVQLDAA